VATCGVSRLTAEQRSRRRTKANARRRVRGTAGISHESLSAQDEMFFMRIRRHARWVFILLAIVFALLATSPGSAISPGSAARPGAP